MAKIGDKIIKLRDQLANLNIKTWVGRAPGASHYIGDITLGRDYFLVERKLTFDEALDLNNRELLVYGNIGIKRNMGDMSSEFLTEKEVIDRARKIFHKKLKQQGAIALVKGERVVIEAKPIIAVHWSTHNHVMKKANRLYKDIEALYDVDEIEEDINYTEIDKMEAEWWKIIEELTK